VVHARELSAGSARVQTPVCARGPLAAAPSAATWQTHDAGSLAAKLQSLAADAQAWRSAEGRLAEARLADEQARAAQQGAERERRREELRAAAASERRREAERRRLARERLSKRQQALERAQAQQREAAAAVQLADEAASRLAAARARLQQSELELAELARREAARSEARVATAQSQSIVRPLQFRFAAQAKPPSPGRALPLDPHASPAQGADRSHPADPAASAPTRPPLTTPPVPDAQTGGGPRPDPVQSDAPRPRCVAPLALSSGGPASAAPAPAPLPARRASAGFLALRTPNEDEPQPALTARELTEARVGRHTARAASVDLAASPTRRAAFSERCAWPAGGPLPPPRRAPSLLTLGQLTGVVTRLRGLFGLSVR
jgi:hypothetical protein